MIPWWPRRPAYDRARILDDAACARARKKRTRAIALYRQVLAFEPQNAELHAKLAPLLAETGQAFDAWSSFKAVARACLRAGTPDAALAVYRDATLYLPREVQAWQSVARLLYRQRRMREAVETLLEGSRRFRTRWLRPQAIYLLRRAREIDPWEFDVVLELAVLLAHSHQASEAGLLLDALAERSKGTRLRRVRAAQLQVAPGPMGLWRWLCEVWRSDGEAPPAPRAADPRPRRSEVVPLHAARLR
jgi:tetratricopeptide (TPR) repeat protein